jgi:hypothetical protein
MEDENRSREAEGAFSAAESEPRKKSSSPDWWLTLEAEPGKDVNVADGWTRGDASSSFEEELGEDSSSADYLPLEVESGKGGSVADGDPTTQIEQV